MSNVQRIHILLAKLAQESSTSPHRFFKTGPGEYAAHDQFLGISVPQLRLVAKQFAALDVISIQELLTSSFNEERLLALLILVRQFQKADAVGKKERYDFYMCNVQYVNNWNLVDSSAHLIVGAYLLDRDKTVLFTLAQSPLLWERRIAIVATWVFIRVNNTTHTYALAKLLLHDSHDLMHKAVGWMLREAGKRDVEKLKNFLDQYAAQMPRTMLRYALEKLSVQEQQAYLRI